MTHFHRSLDAALAKTSPGATGPSAAGEAVAPGDFPTTARALPHERQDGTAGGALQASPATQLVPGALLPTLALVALVVGVLAFGWWAL